MCLRIAAVGCGWHIVLGRKSTNLLFWLRCSSRQKSRGFKRLTKQIKEVNTRVPVLSRQKSRGNRSLAKPITEVNARVPVLSRQKNRGNKSLSKPTNARVPVDSLIANKAKETEVVRQAQSDTDDLFQPTVVTSKKTDDGFDIKEELTESKLEKGLDKEEEWDFFNSSAPDKAEIKETDTDLFQPVAIATRKTDNDFDIGTELTGSKIMKGDLLKMLSAFYSQSKTPILAAESGLDLNLLRISFDRFRRYCVETEHLPVEFHIVLSDILAGAGHVDDIFPYFLQHAKKIFPHLDCIEELRKISDLTEPVHWYPTARNLTRKIIYHVGPTNSGKTYHALKRFITAKSGVYCGPLRMLAVEVFNKCNETETSCDLVTGEDRRQADPDSPAEHVACTVEMTNINKHYEVAIIDEIQMLRDQSRGWAWTRALLGLCADEVHLCGEGSALDIIETLTEICGDKLEVRGYDRLTSLTILDDALVSLNNIRPGDCIVCFRKMDIYSITQKLESLGHQCAVIYGGLPPGTKYAQAEKFNDPADPCNVLVATDAIGMGLNLAIKRIIFFSITVIVNKNGEKKREKLTTSQALQIGGRAGRYRTQYEQGEVTTFNKEDLPVLKDILSGYVSPIEQVGLHPTADQIELFAYHLPKATLSNLIDIFIHLCKVDHQNYFMCNMDDFKFLANMIEHIPLPLKVRYVFCCAPISSQESFVCNMFLKFARQYSTGLPITYEWFMDAMKAPFSPPKTLADLMHLEQAFDVFDLYLWLGYRFPDMFPGMEFTREAQSELDYVIQGSVAAITALLKGQTPKVKPAVIISSEKKYGKPLRRKSNQEPVSDGAKIDNQIDEFKVSDTVGENEKVGKAETDVLGNFTVELSNTKSVVDEKDQDETKQDLIRETISKMHVDASPKYRHLPRRRTRKANEIVGKNETMKSTGLQQQNGEDPVQAENTKGVLRDATARNLQGDDDRESIWKKSDYRYKNLTLSEHLIAAQTKHEGKKTVRRRVPFGRGQLTKAILNKGIITEEMLARLHKEWQEISLQSENDGDSMKDSKENLESDNDNDSNKEES